MDAPTTADYLKYANLQMAAEAFLVSDAGVPKTGNDYVDALTIGNKHASRFTQTQAEAFAAQWEVVSQKPDTNTGFSGTLFRCKLTDPTKGLVAGQMAISFRSTEFIDDAARDCEATNKEISDFGFAFGQLGDMETWYQSIESQIGNN